MKRARISAGAVALAFALSLGAIAPASATIEYVGGGEWDHGVSASTTWSFYHHPTKQHKASVATSDGTHTSGWKNGNVWAFSQLESTAWGNKAYYNYR